MKKAPKKLPLKEFLTIYSKIPRLCVDLIIKTRKGIVLIKRDINPSKGKWHLPGGTVLFGENLTDTIKRISKEETGLNLRVQKILGIMEFPPPNVHAHTISIVYLCEPKSGKLRGSRQGKEIQFHLKVPRNTIKEHKQFLTSHSLIK
jgi:ADP-ribose pyrophosphatase YjhB (NUDIX family)